MWLVGVGGIYGCGCKEVYRFTPLVSVLFGTAASLLFVNFSIFFLFLFQYFL